jgi:stearoyl-CoA desaturase (delta-9 desaturase)
MKLLHNISQSFWLQFVPGMLLSAFTITLLCLGIIPLYYLYFTFIMWILVCGLGIAVGYHRVFSHRTHKIPKWKENIILFFAAFAGQGSSIFWVALHRGYHHPFSDTSKDIHSPLLKGKFHAFVGWYLKITETTSMINIKFAVDLLRKTNHIWFHKNYLLILWGIPLLVALINWKFSLTAFCLVTGLGLLQDNLVNVYGHWKGWFGYRNYKLTDNSHNNMPLALLTWGQGYHNNHHYDPASYDFGSGISDKWYEFDPCKIFLPFLSNTSKK